MRGVDAALKIYNTHTAQAGGSPTTCAPEQLRVYTDLDAAPEPRNLRRLKAEIRTRWGTVLLIDMLKDAVLRTGCLTAVTSAAGRAGISK